MLYDNALLLEAYSRAGRPEVAEGIAGFLAGILRVGDGFASAQDSESTVDGERVEGGYYALDAEGRAGQAPPALDAKVLTGWNGLALGALASAGARQGRADWITLAVTVADAVATEPIVRARIGDRRSSARPTLEDYGMLADGLVDLALATGEVRFAIRARELAHECMAAAQGAQAASVAFVVPGGADPVLASRGLAIDVDPSEGAYPSGLSAMSSAAVRLALLTGDAMLRAAATVTMEFVAPSALERPISFGASLSAMSLLAAPARQLVVVLGSGSGSGGGSDSPLARAARAWPRGTGVAAVVTDEQAAAWSAAGFELFDARSSRDGAATAYLCEDFVCALPVTSVEALLALG